MVEVIPKFEATNSADIKIEEKDLDISIAKSGGPGGQNVNKRETAVRIVHKPSGISVHVTSERSQAQNKEKALDIIRAKLYKQMEDERIAKEKGMYVSKTTSIDWGNQIRSYVLHPYKMVKDHRTRYRNCPSRQSFRRRPGNVFGSGEEFVSLFTYLYSYFSMV